MDVNQFVDIVGAVADALIAQRGRLDALDAVMGDGEHGANIAKCFRAVKENLAAQPVLTIANGLNRVGMTLLSAGGGTATTLMGFALVKTAALLPSEGEITYADVDYALGEMMTSVAEKSKAKEGDKTLMDALIPAVAAMRAKLQSGAVLADITELAAAAAEEGAMRTSQMVAKRGRGLYVGERGVGTEDPGAVSVSILFRAIAHNV